MKKLISLLLCILFIFTLVSCGDTGNANKDNDNTDNNSPKETTIEPVETILNPTEYILYTNIYYNDQAAEYVDKETTKVGIFTILYDAYNNVERYYVWGYNDNTKCCDWQWEIDPASMTDIPKAGSTINVSGTFTYNESALDYYWISNATIKVSKEYSNINADVDTTTMGGTLERVQVINLQNFPEQFEGKKVTVYGRIETPSSVQHPYYDNCFSQDFVSSDAVQAIGTRVVITGTYTDGIIADSTVELSDNF